MHFFNSEKISNALTVCDVLRHLLNAYFSQHTLSPRLEKFLNYRWAKSGTMTSNMGRNPVATEDAVTTVFDT